MLKKCIFYAKKWFFRIFADVMTAKRYISVILPLRLEWEPCYSVPEEIERIEVGDRVKVRFANKEYSGVVSDIDIIPETDIKKIKPVISIEEGIGRIRIEEIALWRAVADYYLCSIGEVYKAAYPLMKVNMEEARATAREKALARKEKLAESIRQRIVRIEARVEKKKEQLAKAKKESTRLTGAQALEVALKDLERAQEALANITRNADSINTELKSTNKDIVLSQAQYKAYSDIKTGIAQGLPVLLNGVTGSGKTEIYMQLAQECLDQGHNVLYLVPEIALSRQLEDRLYEQFGEALLTFHSGETAAARMNTTESVRESEVLKRNYILLGTRSSLFLPHNNLGLVIVDEEHDNSYKQDSPAPRYNGRDTALMLHRIHKCGIVLGSATPSLEEIYNCRFGKHKMVQLKERFHGSEASDIEIIDTKAEWKKNGMRGNFSIKLIGHIRQTLDKGGQVVILRSRRAWASAMQCSLCGEIVKCPHCNVSLSLHRDGRMVCHYCGWSASYSGKCGKCSGELKNLGAGTQKIEEEAAALFPQARIARLDSDTAQNKKFESKTIKDFTKGDIDILIGTQIVTKGFDFSNLKLVAVVSADSLLGIQDFRADEKALQLLEQFRGRCGRREDKGLFVIQTSQPEHPVYQRIANNEAMSLNSDLLRERKDFNFPPYTRIVEINIKDNIEDRGKRMSEKLALKLRGQFVSGGASLLDDPITGPYSPTVDRVADQYIKTIRLSLKKDRNLTTGKEKLRKTISVFEKENRYDGHITINVDPS